jgi:uncharacterized damage-inducible protein DinB
MSPQQQHYLMFAAYNAWANARLYAAAAALPPADFHADRGAFFGSLQRTLNHLLVTDQIWLQRFTGQGVAPERLDAVLHEELPALWAARQAEDARIVQYIDTLDDAALAGSIRYRRVSSPQVHVQALAPALAHWFNHQTHHRGQAHAILTGLRTPAPELDLLFFQREQAAAQTPMV